MASPNDERAAVALIDYVAIIIGPILIMLMVGSLVFFLADVFYQGSFPERFAHTMFFFVFAAVLVARISIRDGSMKAMGYMIALSLAVFIAMQAFVTYPTPALRAIGPILNIALMAIVVWTTNKLTWDCTHLDGERDAGGQGLLAATGLKSSEIKPDENQTTEDDSTDKKKKKKQPATGILGWVDKWNQYREEQKKKPHTPGTWVIYIGLAAIPIFLLGQSMIPASDEFRRRWSFYEMAVFVGSALALLVTTSLLGLKKYLQDRGARIPGAMTASWLGLGAGIIMLFIAIGALLPRPYSETPLVKLPKGEKSDRNANKYALKKDGDAGKGEGKQGNKTEAGDGKNNAKGGEPGGKGQKGESKKGSGEQKGNNGNSSDQKGNQQNQQNDQSNNQQKNSNDSQSKSQQKSENNQKNNQSNNPKQQNENNQNKNDQSGKNNSENKNQDNKNQDSEKQNDAEQSEDNSQSDSGSQSQSNFDLSQMLESLGSGIKWLVWIAIAIAVVVGIVIFFLKFLAPFTAWARNLLDWLKSLFGGRKAVQGDAEVEEAQQEEIERLPSFDSFSNPFRNGDARSRKLPDLIAYSYHALESWAQDQDIARKPGETPNEFATRITDDYPKLESANKLANLVGRLAYSQRPLPNSSLETLKSIWDEMDPNAPAAV
jgi:hypothetical protein